MVYPRFACLREPGRYGDLPARLGQSGTPRGLTASGELREPYFAGGPSREVTQLGQDRMGLKMKKTRVEQSLVPALRVGGAAFGSFRPKSRGVKRRTEIPLEPPIF
jgi:hypothetical protein